jgi:hypothetical protein
MDRSMDPFELFMWAYALIVFEVLLAGKVLFRALFYGLRYHSLLMFYYLFFYLALPLCSFIILRWRSKIHSKTANTIVSYSINPPSASLIQMEVLPLDSNLSTTTTIAQSASAVRSSVVYDLDQDDDESSSSAVWMPFSALLNFISYHLTTRTWVLNQFLVCLLCFMFFAEVHFLFRLGHLAAGVWYLCIGILLPSLHSLKPFKVIPFWRCPPRTSSPNPTGSPENGYAPVSLQETPA